MIITKTPFRLSLFGGGTDFPSWFNNHGGAVLAMALDKYCYVTVRRLPPFFAHHSRIVYSRIEKVATNDRVEHPAIRAILKHLEIVEGLEMHYDADLPARTGLGTSSSFAVGLLHALHTLRGETPMPMELAREAMFVEQSLLNENVGCQDQVLAAFGGLMHVEFNRNSISLVPIALPVGRRLLLLDHLSLYFTGVYRTSSEVSAELVERIADGRSNALSAYSKMVDDAVDILTGTGDITDIGHMLHEAWMIKRSLTSRTSSRVIDEIYEAARGAGALGGKLLGAGGGGFMVFFTPPENRERLRARLGKLLHVPFGMSPTGSRVVLSSQPMDQAFGAPGPVPLNGREALALAADRERPAARGRP